jgi:spore coat protein CotH
MKRFLFLLVLASCITLRAQNNFYAVDTIQVIDITFTQPNWDYQMDTAKAGADGYILAAQCVVNGVVYDSVGVKFKGNSSYDSSRTKNPLHIKLDYVHSNASYDGHEDIRLGNGFSDPTLVREVLAYEILRNYMAAPECNFARVTINGAYYGLFSNVQSIDSEFNSDHFYSSSNPFFKCTPQNVLSGQVPNLIYLGSDSANYTARYEIKSDEGWRELIALCDTLNNNFDAIDTILDIDRALWMLAFNNVTVNLDSYSGAFSQNYYLYMDDNGRFNVVVWDLNMCFGGFTNTGTSNLNISTMQTMTPMLHYNYGARPLIMNLLSDSAYYREYIAHMRTITDEFFSDSTYYFRAQELQALIDSSVQEETNGFYPYAQFQQALTTNTGIIPGVTTLMDARKTYLQSTVQFTAGPPAINAVIATPAAVALNDTAWITCSVANANAVYLGFRDQVWKKFIRVQMHDDGMHQDGAASDGVYGAAMPGTSPLMQYYIYAENPVAGMFSPERAEYEFYSYVVTVSTAAAGQVVINEILSNNVVGCADAAGEREDWIELFNTTGTPLNLEGLYITDNPANHLKCALPSYIIPPYGFALIWADEDAGNANELHANFKLSAGGEYVLLCNANGTVLDSVAFGALSTDASYGRCPNGNGPFINYSWGGCGGWNICPSDVAVNTERTGVAVYPNPAMTVLNVVNFGTQTLQYEMVSATGQVCASGQFVDTNNQIDMASFATGMYILMVRDEQGNFLTSERIVKE